MGSTGTTAFAGDWILDVTCRTALPAGAALRFEIVVEPIAAHTPEQGWVVDLAGRAGAAFAIRIGVVRAHTFLGDWVIDLRLRTHAPVDGRRELLTVGTPAL